MRIVFLFLAASFFAYSQNRPPLHEFLDLTPEQVATITQNNQSYNQSTQEKQRRILQVQREIAVWTEAEPLDPTQLGIRYAEIEAICRGVLNESLRYRKLNHEALTEAQLAKLSVLEEVIQLYPTAVSAGNSNLIGTSQTPVALFSMNRWFDTGAFLLGPTVPGCRSPSPFPNAIIRCGDFSDLPQTDQPR